MLEQAGGKESSDEVKIMFTGLVPTRKHKQMIHDIGIEKASTVMRELRSLIGDFNMACYFSWAGVQSKPRASSAQWLIFKHFKFENFVTEPDHNKCPVFAVINQW